MLLTEISSTIATVAATSTSYTPTSTTSGTPTSTSTPSSRPGAENGECQLLGPFALFIQGALGLLALLSLVFKRWRERPQRPVKVWAFDASKQVVGSMLLHVANLLMSIISSGEMKPKAGDFQANPCSFYLLNLAIDTTLGIPILIVILRVLTYAFSRTAFASPPESIQSGNYGSSAHPKTSWWLRQCFIYFLGLLGMKFCVFVIFQLCPWIVAVGNWALRWTEGDERVQVFFVMLFFPVIMNALQYYIIDGFIKDQKPSADHEALPSEDEENEEASIDGDDDEGQSDRRHRRQGQSVSSTFDDHAGSEENGNDKEDVGIHVREESVSKASGPAPLKHRKDEDSRRAEYDPDKDGAGSSSSQGSGPVGAARGHGQATTSAQDGARHA